MKGVVKTVLARPSNGQAAGSQQAQQGEIPILRASDLVGRDVRDPQGRDAGRVNSVIIDTQNGVVEYVLIEGRGSFDLKGQLIAVPWSALQPPSGKGDVQTRVAADKLQQAPRIAGNLADQLSAPGWQSRVYGYYGYGYPYYPYSYPGYRGRPAPGAAGYAASGAAPGAPAAAAPGGSTGSAPQHVRQNTAQTGSQQGQPEQNPATLAPPFNGLKVGPNSVVSSLMSAKNVSSRGLESADVYAANGDRVGHIDEVLIDTRRGYVAYVLLRRGGFLGLNPTWFALPVEALTWSPYNAQYGYRLTVDERLLENVPPVPANEARLITYVPKRDLAELYQHFGIKPYWSAQGPAKDETTAPSAGGQSGAKP